jgi:hypothetical protein
MTAEATSSETLRTSPAQLRIYPVEVEIRMLTLDPSVSSGLDLGVDLPVQVRHCVPLRYFPVGQTFCHYPGDLMFACCERVNLMLSYPG